MPLDPISAGLAGALAYGGADFAGGQASRVLTPLRSAALAQVLALFVTLAMVLPGIGVFPSVPVALSAVLAGGFYSVGLVALYKGFAEGSVGLVAPAAGLVGVLIPVAAGVAITEAPSAGCAAGLGLAIVSVVLLGYSAGRDKGTLRSLQLGVLSGVGYGVSDLLLGLVPAAEMQGALCLLRVVATASIALVVIGEFRRRAGRVSISAAEARPAFWRPVLALAVFMALVAGMLDALGHQGFAHSAAAGPLSVAAALVALHPLVSLVLAAVVLRESLHPLQMVGSFTSVSSMAFLATS
jgi:drug/metabolite transporter (DMT)-like permease